MTEIRAVLVDDEPLARELLREELADIADVRVVGEASDGELALTEIRRLRPDVVFLDIEMPELGGMAVLRTLERPPLVVFVTAHDEFAVEAFEVGALDYVTKPLRRERVAEAVARVRRELRRRAEPGEDPSAAGGRTPRRWQDALLGADGRIRRFVARSAGRARLIPVNAVVWARSAGNYVEIHTDAGAHLVRMPLSDLEARLDPDRFRRIHRSHLVNLDRIVEIRSDGHGAWEVELAGGRVLRMTPTYRDRVFGACGCMPDSRGETDP